MNLEPKLSAAQTETRLKIIKAASACIRKFGLAKTAMDDVAKAAGLSRKTLYRSFSSRHDLLNAVVIECTNEFVDRLRSIVDSGPTFADAIVYSTMEGLKWMRRDHVFISAIEGASDRGVERYLIDPKSVLHNATLDFWKDAFMAAQQRGELRQDLTDQEFVSCLRAANLMLWLREDLKPAQQEEYIRKFFLPVLVAPASAKQSSTPHSLNRKKAPARN